MFGQGVKNHFEVSLNPSSFNVDNNTTNNLCLPKHDQNTESQSPKLYHSVQNAPASFTPRMQYLRSTGKSSKLTS